MAFVLMFMCGVMLILVQGALVVRDHVLVVHAARDAARVASTGVDPFRVEVQARHALADADVSVSGGGAVGEPLTVQVTYVSHTDVPLVGPLLPDIELGHSVTMRAEK